MIVYLQSVQTITLCTEGVFSTTRSKVGALGFVVGMPSSRPAAAESAISLTLKEGSIQACATSEALVKDDDNENGCDNDWN